MASHSEHSESEYDPNDERWDDWEEDETQVDIKCLFCSNNFSAANDMFEHCIKQHGFDFRSTRTKLNLDFYRCIRLINYIRLQAMHKPQFEETTSFNVLGTEPFLEDDEYLKPVIAEDPLLYGFEEDYEDNNRVFEMHIKDHKEEFNPTTTLERELLNHLHILEERLLNTEAQLKKVETQFSEYRSMVKEAFFDVYSDERNERSLRHDIHAEMLKDHVRTESYRDFIYENKDIFKGKLVLDVGCGTGILSLFAARAGASKVFSVDESAIINRAKEIVAQNKLDHVITLISGKIEEVTLPVPKVDIIISEWMGYFLLFEAMLDSLIVARDRWLAPGGILAPSHCRIMFTTIEDEDLISDALDFWNDVYGFDMTPMRSTVQSSAFVESIDEKSIVTNIITLKDLPLQTISKNELDFNTPFTLIATRKATVHAFLGYFDTWFTRDGHPIPISTGVNDKIEGITSFTTGPQKEVTHWRQTVFLLDKGILVEEGTKITGFFECCKDYDNPRDLVIKIQFCVVNGDVQTKEITHKYYLK